VFHLLGHELTTAIIPANLEIETMLNRGYSILTVKSIDDDQRIIIGTATTPATDRVGDVVEPLGVKAAPDVPLFLYHDARKTVGRAKLGKATAAGVPFEASMPKITEPGPLKDRIDEAWGLVKHRLITGVSIGFRPVADKIEQLASGGLRFLECEVLELSLVPIPANSQATIAVVKDLEYGARENPRARADSRQHDEVAERLRKSTTPVTVAMLMAAIDVITKAVKERDAHLVTRIKELERHPFTYRGVFRAGERYAKNSAVTYGGSLWICSSETADNPPAASWILAVRKGQDAR
jgi:HK97 family phage prohead protease